jgi:hypothetical protein
MTTPATAPAATMATGNTMSSNGEVCILICTALLGLCLLTVTVWEADVTVPYTAVKEKIVGILSKLLKEREKV